MKDYIIVIIIILVIIFLIFSCRLNKSENMNNILNEQKEKDIIKNNTLDLFDDTIVRIKVHRINFNWIEPYNKNPAEE